MNIVLKHKRIFPALGLFLLVLVVGLVTSAFAGESSEPVKTPAVLELEKEMARDVPIYNEVAPRLSKNRAALRTLGWDFDDSTLEVVPFQ